MKHGYWRIRTRRGEFQIRRHRNGRWWILLNDEPLEGGYARPESALDDLVGGHTSWPSEGFDPSRVGLPDELGDWEFVSLRK